MSGVWRRTGINICKKGNTNQILHELQQTSAICNGRVTSWQYCFYFLVDSNADKNNDFSTRFYVYRRTNSSTQLYEQAPGSALTVIWEADQVQRIGCANVTLNETQQFQVNVNGLCLMLHSTHYTWLGM